MEKLLINIFNNDLEWMGTIDSVETLVHRSSWHEIVNSEMTVSKTAQSVEELQIGRILVINNQRDKALIIEDMTTSINDNYWTFTLIPLKGMLNYRICHPTDAGAFTAKKQSEVMRSIVNNNLITQTRDNDRKFWDSTGTRNMFGVDTLNLYGDTIDFTVDWETGYIGDAITTIAKMYSAGYPIGWNIYINEAWSAFHFQTYQAINKTINQTALPPVVFSEDFGNIINANYTYSIKEWRNVAYMIWNNDTADQISTITNTSKGATKSFNRKEIIIDSSKKISSEVTSEGRSELNKRPHVESFSAEIINNVNTMSTYGIDWFLGDIVTIQSKAIKKNQMISIDAQITEIEEVFDSGEYSINATFGEGKLSFVQIIKNAINQK
jgi:hypothetical protein